MRLSTQQTNDIILAITPFLDGNKAELRLYGSRVKDDLKGGDIDRKRLINPTYLQN